MFQIKRIVLATMNGRCQPKYTHQLGIAVDDARSAWILFGDLLQFFLLVEEAQEISEALMPLSDTCTLLAKILLEFVELPVMAGRPSRQLSPDVAPGL